MESKKTFKEILLLIFLLVRISSVVTKKKIFQDYRTSFRRNIKIKTKELKNIMNSKNKIYSMDLKNLYTLVQIDLLDYLEKNLNTPSKTIYLNVIVQQYHLFTYVKQIEKSNRIGSQTNQIYLQNYRVNKSSRKLCKKISSELENEKLEAMLFKKVYYSIKLQKLLGCEDYSKELWMRSIPMGPFNQQDMNQLTSNLMEYYYFFKLQIILYPKDVQTLSKLYILQFYDIIF